jgi:hypothetical protein
MAANQRNTNMFTYHDKDGVVWNARGEIDAAVNAIDGSAPFTPGAPVWIDTKRRISRKVIFFDPGTFRTKRVVVFTVAAFAAITGATTLAVNVPGEVAARTYNVSQFIQEKQPVAKASRNLTDAP